MTFKTTILAGAALLSAIAAAPVSAETYADRGYGGGWGRPPMLPRVTAVGASLNPHEARRIAVHAWRDQVANRFGFQYSRWFAARNKDVDCVKVADDDPVWDTYGKRDARKFAPPRHYEPVTRCTVSAHPSRGWGGWYGYLAE